MYDSNHKIFCAVRRQTSLPQVREGAAARTLLPHNAALEAAAFGNILVSPVRRPKPRNRAVSPFGQLPGSLPPPGLPAVMQLGARGLGLPGLARTASLPAVRSMHGAMLLGGAPLANSTSPSAFRV